MRIEARGRGGGGGGGGHLLPLGCSSSSRLQLRWHPKCTLNHTKQQKTWQDIKETVAHNLSCLCFSLHRLQQLHAYAISFGLHRSPYISSLLITNYSSFRHLQNARRVFHHHLSTPPPPTTTKPLVWNSLMRAYSKNQHPRLVLAIYHQMTTSCICAPDNQTFNLVITACTHLSHFEFGSRLHSQARSRQLELDLLVATALVNMYCKAGDIETAQRIFDRMPVRDAVACNALICGYASMGSLHKAMSLFHSMRFFYGISPTEATIVSLLSVCGDLASLYHGGIVHAHVIKVGFGTAQFVINSLMEMYIKCGMLRAALELFDAMRLKDVVSWSIIVGGFVRYGHPTYALQFLDKMIFSGHVWPTRPILLNAILACADLGDWQRGKHIEEDYIKSSNNGFQTDISLNTALIYMYTKCGQLETSLKFLNRVSIEDQVIAWNAMLKACAELRKSDWASKFCLEMQRRNTNPNSITFLTLLPLFSSLSLLRKGMESHGCIIKRGFVSERSVANSLIDMYAKCGYIEDASEIFNGIPVKNVVSWSSIIKSYAWNGNATKALDLFELMRTTGLEPNHITFLAVLSACSHAGFTEKGVELYKSMKEEYGLEPTVEHFSCLVDLFCRAGFLWEAHELIKNKKMATQPSVALWGTILTACRNKGDWVLGEEVAKRLFCLEPRNPANYMMLAEIYILVGRRSDANGVFTLMKERGLARKPGCSWLELPNFHPHFCMHNLLP